MVVSPTSYEHPVANRVHHLKHLALDYLIAKSVKIGAHFISPAPSPSPYQSQAVFNKRRFAEQTNREDQLGLRLLIAANLPL